jgi:membrane-bound ClpP family serine protease
MPKRIKLRLLLTVIISLVEDAIIIFVLFFVLSRFGIEMPVWLIVTLALIFSIITYVIYRSLKKNPQLGFENMIGKSGMTVNQLARKGTVKIGWELWAAEVDGDNIEAGKEVTVIGQTGLKLTVIKKSQEGLTNQLVS